MKLILKVTFLSLAACFFSSNIIAQDLPKDSTNKKFYYEQGLNCTQFIKQFLSFNESFESNMPYLLTGNIGYKNIGLRYGTNYQITTNKSKITSSSSSNIGGGTSSDPLNNELSSTDINNRIGLYYRKNYFKRLNISIGLDYLIENLILKTKSESSQVGGSETIATKAESKTTTNATGYGPCMAINYKIWKSFYLGTEAALYYISGKSTQEADTYISVTPNSPFGTFGFQSQETSTKTSFGGTEIRIPLTLYAYFKF